MKKTIQKIIGIGLSMCILLTQIPTESVHAENTVQENIIEESYGWENGNQELDLSAIPEDVQKENSIGEYRPNEVELAETPLKEATKTTADSGNCGEENSEVTWEYADGILTISGTGKMMDYPSGAPWYKYRYEITSLTVESGVTYIGEAAFYGCSMLETVSLSKTIRGIGKGAFANCYYLKEITLPNKITKINDYTFQNCALSSVTLPASLKNFSALAFFRCNNLESITISEKAPLESAVLK